MHFSCSSNHLLLWITSLSARHNDCSKDVSVCQDCWKGHFAPSSVAATLFIFIPRSTTHASEEVSCRPDSPRFLGQPYARSKWSYMNDHPRSEKNRITILLYLWKSNATLTSSKISDRPSQVPPHRRRTIHAQISSSLWSSRVRGISGPPQYRPRATFDIRKR